MTCRIREKNYGYREREREIEREREKGGKKRLGERESDL